MLEQSWLRLAKETTSRIEELQDQWLRGEVRDFAEFAGRACLIRTDSPTSSLHKDVGVQCTMPKDRASYKGKGKDAHELKSCDKGTQMSSQCIPRNRPIYH